MSLTISDIILDEESRATQTGTADDNDVTEAIFLASTVDEAVAALLLTTVSGFTGFPQHAVKTNFVSSTNPVTDYFLTSNSNGDPFPAGGVATSLYVGGDQVFLFATADPNIVVGRLGNGTTADPNGDVALLICIEETKDTDGFVTSANMWTCIFAPLVENGENLVDSADELDLAGLIYLGSDFDTTTEVPFENFASVPSGQDAFALVGPTSGSSTVDLLITGFAGNTVGTVNVSTQGLGTNAQHVDEGESLRIDIVDANAANFANADEASEVHVEANLGYAGGHKDAIGATFEIEQVTPTPVFATVTVRAYHTATNFQGAGFNANAIASPGTPVTIDVEDVIILNAAGDDITAAFLARANTDILADGQGVKIIGLLAHEQVKFTTDSAFNRFTVTNSDTTSGPDTWDLGAIKVIVIEGGADSEFADLGSHLIFQDDGPNIDPSGASVTALTADETAVGTDPSGSFAGLFGTPDYGADGAGSLVYTLGVSSAAAVSGLTDTQSGNGVFLFLESGEVVGREGTSATDAETGDEVFRISVDSGGNVTLDQSRAVVHSDSNDHDSTSAAMSAGLITLTATIFDSEAANENDSDSAVVNIGDRFLFKDDGPTIAGSPNPVTEPNNLEVANTNGASDSSSYVLTPGADGLGSFVIVGPADASGDFTWQYFDVDGDSSTDNNEIKGFYKGAALYTLELEDDGTYEFNMIGTLPSSPLGLDVNDIKAGGPDSTVLEVGVLGTDPRFVEIQSGGGPINESNDNVGVTNGNFDTGESLTFKLFDGATQLSFQGINIGTKSAQGGTYNWSATPVGGGAPITGSVTVLKNGTIVVGPGADQLNGVLVDSITITKASGTTTKIGLDDIDLLVPPNDVQLSFTVRETDGDNDFASQSFTVDIDGNLDGTYSANVNALSLPVSTSTSVALKRPGLVDDSGMGPILQSAPQGFIDPNGALTLGHDYLLL